MLKRFIPAAVLMVSMLSTATMADTYKVDPVHSSIMFKNHHLGAGYVWGRFNQFAGTFNMGEKASDFSIDMTVQVASVDTGNADRDKHLKNPDFFDAAQFPTITFKSTKAAEGKDDMIEVTGDLTLHGVTKSIVVNIKKTGTGTNPMTKAAVAGIETVFTIKRTDFGMSKMVGPSGDEVMLTVNLEAGKQ